MHERRNDGDLRDRMTTLEVKFDNHAGKMDEVVRSQAHSSIKLDQIFILMAEQRGAGKAIKIIWAAIISLLGFFGGIIGSLMRHA